MIILPNPKPLKHGGSDPQNSFEFSIEVVLGLLYPYLFVLQLFTAYIGVNCLPSARFSLQLYIMYTQVF